MSLRFSAALSPLGGYAPDPIPKIQKDFQSEKSGFLSFRLWEEMWPKLFNDFSDRRRRHAPPQACCRIAADRGQQREFIRREATRARARTMISA
jgi:hypothetical protein